ncbi:YheU family protein [uncultured Desulfobacter sp.]|uniref:YheU family protein n=1 Tax=uncultured Desulfobacter sp. TaxID=240139 RepID=UPI002AAB9650|nr:YheU family protein [uncultured Desulfobacter sp.]
MNVVKIPYDQLSLKALHGVVEEFVTRDGTDYGEVEVPLGTKISQVLANSGPARPLSFLTRKRIPLLF